MFNIGDVFAHKVTGEEWKITRVAAQLHGNEYYIEGISTTAAMWVSESLLISEFLPLNTVAPQTSWELKLPEGYKVSFDNHCFHDFKLYQGFTESYEYCTKCDTKRELLK